MPALSAFVTPRKNARHAKPSRVGPVLVAGGMTAAFAVTDASLIVSSASAGGGSVSDFERLASCESGGNWSINTGNGYYGGLQFNLATWRGLGFGGYPHTSSKATQIAAGQKLYGQRGWGPWPSCSRSLGLTSTPDSGTAAPATQVASSTTSTRRESAARASRSRPVSSAAPRFDGHVMTVADRSAYRASTMAWQRQMRARGWRISVDGRFGPQSSAVARRFAAEKHLETARPGTVDRAVFTAAWTAPRS